MPTPDDYNNNQPGLLQRGPTSLLPPIPPSQNDNDPTKTQEAAVPRVPPPTPRTDRPATPGDTQPQPPTPQQAPYTPVPWHAQQPPPAPPEPPLGNWTPDQVAPWLKAHLPTIPGSLVPNRPPDGYRGNQPVYNLRPGEPGYTAGGNSNILTGAVSWLESRNNGPFGDPSTLGQKAAFQAQYGSGPQGITNYAQQLLRANPNATFGDFYAGYALGTGDPRRAPTIEDLRTRYPEAYKNLVTNFPAQAGGGGALPGTPSGPQGPWTQANLEPNFAYRTGQLGQPGNVQLTNVTSPNGQSWSVNARVAPQFQGFLNDLYKAGYTGMASSGGYNNRPIVGGSIPSEHAYGAAIDIGAAHNPLQYVSAGGALKTDLPPNVGDIAAKWGLKWGGTFHDRQDPMHFEVAALMTPEQIQAAQNGAVTTTPQGTRVNAGAIGINTPLSTLLGSTVAAPPQQYIPPQPREPQHWGREPEHDWTPGRMPTSHDIPNILGALLPIAIAGVLGGGGLGMIAAYTGYQNARNKGQLEEAKEARTRWRDQLAETEAGLKEELLESSGLMAEYGNDFTSPAAQQAWGELAAKYQDPQLRAALESGNHAAVEQLFKKRDEAFQSINKVSAADTKAAQQEQEKQSNEAAERSTVNPDGGGGAVGGAPSATPAAARGPERPWENLGPGFLGGGGPAAGAQPPGGGRPAPTAAPQPAEQPATEQPPAEQPEAPTPAAPQPAAVPGGEQPAAPGGARQPDASLDVGVGGLQPANLPARLSPQVTGLTPERLDQDARQYLETQKDPYKGGPSGDPLAIKRNEAVRVRASQMQSFIDHVIATTPPGQIDSALQKIDTVDPGLAAVARVVDRGDSAPPTGWQLRSPFYQTINKLVTSLDPSWDATRWVTNYRTKAGFATGTQSNQVASANRALQHMTVLYNAAAMLQNQDYPTYNAFINALRTAGGDDAVTSFTIARMHVAQELEKVFRGSSGAASEIKADIDTVNSSASPQQIKGYIRTTTELLKGQLDALADLYSRGTHKKITGEDLLSPEGRATYERMIKLPIDETALQPKWTNQIVEPHLDETATLPPESQSGPGPAPVEIPQGWVEQPQQ